MKTNLLQRIHLIGTLWFILCVGFILTIALREAGFNWWIIFSLSGHSLVVCFVLISLYLFAMFRGGTHAPTAQQEHPLTTSEAYMFFYAGAPLLGAVAGLLALNFERSWLFSCNIVSLATFGATLTVWLVVDPILGIFESMTPTSRRLREKRQQETRQEKLARQINRDAILAEVSEREEYNRQKWSRELQASADELAELLNVDATRYQWAGIRAVELGLLAYRLGGIRCMRLLHEMALKRYQKNYPQQRLADYITYWWDGIGTWHSPATE